jgi:hypothetical protein
VLGGVGVVLIGAALIPVNGVGAVLAVCGFILVVAASAGALQVRSRRRRTTATRRVRTLALLRRFRPTGHRGGVGS